MVRSDTITFRDFIKTVESVLGIINIDTDSLTQTFPVPDFRPAPAELEPKPPRHSEEEAAPLESERRRPRPNQRGNGAPR